MSLRRDRGINVTRPHIDMVRQPTDDTCFAACVATLTGIPIDALPLHKEAALDTINFGPDIGYLIATDDMKSDAAIGGRLPNMTSLEDWQRGIDNAAILEGWTHWDNMLGRGVLCLVMWRDAKAADGHAVVIDEEGFLHDPGAGAFEGVHIMSLLRACNVTVAGFVSFTEVE